MDLEIFDSKFTNTKLANLFLGFFEGLFLDGEIHTQELQALVTWVETYPNCIDIPHFENLYRLLVKSYESPSFLLENKSEIQSLFQQFKNSKFFIRGTADIQRLHGLMAGVICDQNLRSTEVIELKRWLEQKEYLNEHFIYDEIYKILNKLKYGENVSHELKFELIDCLKKYVNIDDYGLPLAAVSSQSNNFINLDFYHDVLVFSNLSYCFTGASVNYLKSDWKEIVESKGGLFTDSLTKKVDYLVICNKGNPNWAQMSYGRKFEQARKMQNENNKIRIITEDHFVKFI